ncbi:MAG: peptide chain release factor 2 [Kiritimatiellae bacterium]|jgi:peptide chain release factor 2|nr:peptide chain release factor 2 [Kiritimatiellia bacterium]
MAEEKKEKLLETEEVRQKVADLKVRVAEMADYVKVAERRKRLAELEALQAGADFWNNQTKAREVISATNAERAYVIPYDSLVKSVEDAEVMLELASMEEGEAQETALRDTLAECERAEGYFGKLRLQSLLGGKFDQCNVFVKLHAGQGGTEACDWVAMLYRMYQRYAETQGWKVEEYDIQPGEEAGYKDVYFRVEGSYAFGMLKAERGIHRLVRISPFDANKRRQTSFASMETVAEINDDIEVEIKDEDLRIDTYRSGGAGGQHVNKTDSAVRLTHLPTGIVVACQKERSQHMNKEKAMNMLKAQLYEYYEDQKKAEMDRFYGAKSENGWGSQIRSYVFCPYTMVKDLRTEHETSDVNRVMDGDLQPFVEAWLQMKAK